MVDRMVLMGAGIVGGKVHVRWQARYGAQAYAKIVVRGAGTVKSCCSVCVCVCV